MSNYTCTSVANIEQIKDVTEQDAKRIRAIWKAEPDDLATIEPNLMAEYKRQHYNTCNRHFKQWAIDHIINTCGVEILGFHKASGKGVYYCNAGDPYATTVLFIGCRLVVGCWGDMVERHQINEAA